MITRTGDASNLVGASVGEAVGNMEGASVGLSIKIGHMLLKEEAIGLPPSWTWTRRKARRNGWLASRR